MRACLLIDYQNIHLTGHNHFCPRDLPRHLSLMHPAPYAEQVQKTRNAKRHHKDPVEIERVIAFRGMPSQRHEPTSNARAQAQRSEWTRSPKVEVIYRPLKYPRRWPDEKAQEKGIDVLLAVELIEQARSGEWDVVILATHDTDLEPAVAIAEQQDSTTIETTGWQGAKRLRGGDFKRWHTFLDAASFVHSRDRKNYDDIGR